MHSNAELLAQMRVFNFNYFMFTLICIHMGYWRVRNSGILTPTLDQTNAKTILNGLDLPLKCILAGNQLETVEWQTEKLCCHIPITQVLFSNNKP